MTNMTKMDGRFVALDGRFVALKIRGERAYQEDNCDLWHHRDTDGNEHALMLVADGMGGHVGGAKASKRVCETFVESYKLDSLPIAARLHAGLVATLRDPCPECGTACIADRLRYCLDKANAAIADKVAQKPHLKGMGTTLVAAVISQGSIEWISVGDSPMWLFSADKLKLDRLNADHSMAFVFEKLVKKRRMSAEEAATDPNRHALLSAVMGDDIPKIDPPRRCQKTKCDVLSQPVEIKNDDLLLLASDGLMTLDEGKIESILQDTQRKSLEDRGKALIQEVKAKKHPHQDNTTVLLYTPEANCGEDSVTPAN